MFRCARLASFLLVALSVEPWDIFTANWLAVGEECDDKIARERGWYVRDGVRVKLHDYGADGIDAPLREFGGSAADVGGCGD